jgi:cation diffusion facilitator CzcD-associated flavoprotein CzcO
MMTQDYPVVVIGAGPIGLAAASHLLARGIEPLVLEAGPAVGHSVSDWAHVRMFSPWGMNIDHASRRLLEADGWAPPDLNAYPTGAEIVSRYLAPLAATPALAPHIRTHANVVGVARHDPAGRRHPQNRAARSPC